MKARWMIVLGLLLLAVSCEPFLLSTFPGYLADATAVADLSGTINGASVEQFYFFVLDNGTTEYAFILAYMYDGSKNLYVFSSNLSPLFTASNSNFGSRHFVSAGTEFVVGSCYFPSSSIIGNNPTSIAGINMMGPDGNGCVLYCASSGFSPEPVNVLLQAGNSDLSAQVFSQGWGASFNPPNVSISSDGQGYDLVYCGRLYYATIGSVFGNASILVFRDRNGWPQQGTALVYLDNSDYSDYSNPTPLLNSSALGRIVIPLGGLNNNNNSSSAFAVQDGLVVRGSDGNMRLIGWDSQVKATTRDDGASGQVLIDFSPVDYYYVFDPASLKLYKARDWWEKN